MFRGIGLALSVSVIAAGLCQGAVPQARVLGVEVQGTPEIREHAMKLGLEKLLGQVLSDQVVDRGVEKLKHIGRAAAVKVDFQQGDGGSWVTYRVRENPKIESIEFTGNTLMTGKELLADLKVAPGQVLDYDILYREVNRIPHVYLARKGVLYAGVLSPARVTVEGGKVTIDIQEFKLKKLEVRGVRGRLKQTVLAQLPLRKGQALRKSELLGGLFNVYQLPQVKDIDYVPQFDREKGEITVVLNLTEEGQEAPKPSPAGHSKLD